MPSPDPKAATNPMDLVADLPPRRWSSDDAVSYEAAQEAINEVLACYAALLDQEEQKPTAPERMAYLHAQIEACARQQRVLSPHNPDELAAIRASYSRRLTELREELG
ncbi:MULTISPECIES: hypothetical protein [unclassified Pseudonocardia]|uniref:hypothetical protein n=1 Tax=unclassified Pseudonocardia TaxID=2619320 RepID=UPI00068082C5|nr:hypothetical protein [Pseudonocardia sp. Ae707_Ps1]OLM09132.1 hypothetical protein Ae707Ps1_6079c [Pseudonocardia sp. Ae707_Ps1]